MAQNCHVQMDRETRDRYHLGTEWILERMGRVRTQDGEGSVFHHVMEVMFWAPQKGPDSGCQYTVANVKSGEKCVPSEPLRPPLQVQPYVCKPGAV